jgi:thiamine biosynthesis lipoprotein ApbE
MQIEGGLLHMSCSIDKLSNKIDELRTSLNEVSISLLESNDQNNSEVLNISKKMDDLINEYIALAEKNEGY